MWMLARIATTIAVLVATIAVAACGDAAPPHAPRPRFPIVDIHTHLGGVETWPGSKPNFREILATMDTMHVELLVDFKAPDNSLVNGIFGERVTQRIAAYPDTGRFKLFANVPIDDDHNLFIGSRRPDYPTWIAAILEDAVRRGAAGLKIKDQAGEGKYSYWTRDTAGTPVPFDDPAFDPLWTTAERLGISVLVHLAGAYKGEHQAPNGPNRHIRWEMLMLQRERVLRKYPRLKLIGAHWAGCAGDRTYLEEILEKYPNMSTEGGANQPKAEFAQLDTAEQRFFDRFQDQVLFGTDYMESTFRWLKSYRQRLDMFLPFTERWPLADSVMMKYYNGNARRLLARAKANDAPVAHPGFTVTRLVGDTIGLDGSASFGGGTSPLKYRWRQLEGSPVRLVGDTTAHPVFIATTAGDYAFDLVAGTGAKMSRPRSVRVNVLARDATFFTDTSRIVIEAEHFGASIARSGHAWTVARERAGYSGDGYVVAGPVRGTVVEPGQFRLRAPELRYALWIERPGTYVVYVRGIAADSASNSVHIGLDNEEVRLADRVGGLPVGRWGWVRDASEWDAQFQMTDTTLAVLNIVEPGPHLLNVWMHRDGVMLDRVMLVRAPFAEVARPLFDPGANAGPPQSARIARPPR